MPENRNSHRRVRIAIAGCVAAALVVVGAAIVAMAASQARIGAEWFVATDPRALLPNYRDIPWAARHFFEQSQGRLVHQSLIGWRHDHFAGRTVNVVGEQRERQTALPGRDGGKLVYFFGGSAMWGVGSNDDSTIPSIAAREADIRARNFGERAYTAHQNLVMFIRLIEEGHRPDVAVFYDGSDDVTAKCRRDADAFSVADESQLRERIGRRVGSPGYVLYPFLSWMEELLPGDPPRPPGDCDADPAKARRVAGALVDVWRIARMVARSHGIRFEAFLQPVVFFSKSRAEHVAPLVSDAQRRQYAAVYPIVAELLRDSGFDSLAGALDSDEYFFIDCCHLSPNGNRVIAGAIAAALR